MLYIKYTCTQRASFYEMLEICISIILLDGFVTLCGKLFSRGNCDVSPKNLRIKSNKGASVILRFTLKSYFKQ